MQRGLLNIYKWEAQKVKHASEREEGRDREGQLVHWEVPNPRERKLTEGRKEITFCIPNTIILHLHIWWEQSRAYYIEGNISDMVQLTLSINTGPAVHILCHHFLKPLFPLSAVTRTPLPTIAWQSPPTKALNRYPKFDIIRWKWLLIIIR